MDYCDTNKDGMIDYEEFANFLNWKDKLPSGIPQSGIFCLLLMFHFFNLTEISRKNNIEQYMLLKVHPFEGVYPSNYLQSSYCYKL